MGLNLGIDDADDKSIDEVMEVVRAARGESGITYVDFNTGHYEGDTYLDLLEPFIVRIKKELGLLVGVQTPPHRDLERYDHLREIGVNRVSFCFEIFDRQLFQEICPGKHAEYGLDHYLEAIRYCAALARKGPTDEPWVTNGEIIAGLEPPESSIRAIDWITGVGASAHRLRVPPPGWHGPGAPGAAPDGGHGPRVPPPLRGLHGARPAHRRGAQHPREPRDAARGVPVAEPPPLSAGRP